MLRLRRRALSAVLLFAGSALFWLIATIGEDRTVSLAMAFTAMVFTLECVIVIIETFCDYIYWKKETFDGKDDQEESGS